jgi:hypothetical protein
MPETDAPNALVLQEDPRETRIRCQSRDNAEEADLVADRPSPSKPRSEPPSPPPQPSPDVATVRQILAAAVCCTVGREGWGSHHRYRPSAKSRETAVVAAPPWLCLATSLTAVAGGIWREREAVGGDGGAAARGGGGLPLSELLGDLLTP